MQRTSVVVLVALLPASAWAGAPAKIKRASESTLNQIILSDAAVKRTGIELADITKKSVPDSVSVPATVLAKPGTAAVLFAPMAGVVLPPPGKSELLPPGTFVKAGQTVMRLRPFVAPGQNLAAGARRDVDQAQARFITAEKARRRAQQLLKDGAGDQAGLESAEESYSVAQAELSASKMRLDQIRRSPLGADVSIAIRAPSDGVVLRLTAALQQTVASGQILGEVVDGAQLWVRAEVYAGLVSDIDTKASASFVPLGGTQPSLVRPSGFPPAPLNDGSVVALWFIPSADANLTVGTRAQLRLLKVDSVAPRLTVPWPAILYDAQGGAWVYAAIAKNTFERRRVEVEAVVADTAVLKHGPAVGTKIVVVGATELFGTEFGIGK